VQIRIDDLSGEPILHLLAEHLDNMYAITPPESVHALDVAALRAPGITFWSAWDGDELLGCGALKELDHTCGEIKSMRTVVAHRGRGVASRILDRIVEEAHRRTYHWLYLETGTQTEFAPARALYSRHGFEQRGPFGDYVDDPNSVFMAKRLRA
jgi:putative acetyltransferase